MPHALAVRHVVVGDDERDAYLQQLATRRASAAACGVHFWTFEHEAERGRFVEFVETADRATLTLALTQDALGAGTDVYVELAPLPDSH